MKINENESLVNKLVAIFKSPFKKKTAINKKPKKKRAKLRRKMKKYPFVLKEAINGGPVIFKRSNNKYGMAFPANQQRTIWINHQGCPFTNPISIDHLNKLHYQLLEIKSYNKSTEVVPISEIEWDEEKPKLLDELLPHVLEFKSIISEENGNLDRVNEIINYLIKNDPNYKFFNNDFTNFLEYHVHAKNLFFEIELEDEEENSELYQDFIRNDKQAEYYKKKLLESINNLLEVDKNE